MFDCTIVTFREMDIGQNEVNYQRFNTKKITIRLGRLLPTSSVLSANDVHQII